MNVNSPFLLHFFFFIYLSVSGWSGEKSATVDDSVEQRHERNRVQPCGDHGGPKSVAECHGG
ncbi:uncharacterized protein THITE_2115598 [Thermothielavioides terrestris NRRL 8126]|uniref:Uncharacterized protein n=1 Tax=Thermothielavioides terrestris (strain ATCC 38088 / NRRL 8126) TaxID=578455 RepID=G2R4Y5_THETT|nr:uncharacterized protein THITE_2115598 [Thermothielavioides terrestris NRRL 8126]AEO66970.1 hypothetical protein THITE_2115598 [Thermothielavioides terrestris NRRL 8126]